MTTASGSTAGSSGTCRKSASTSSRAGRGPGSCAWPASAQCRATGSRPGRRSACRRLESRAGALRRGAQTKRDPLTDGGGAVRPRHGDLRGSAAHSCSTSRRGSRRRAGPRRTSISTGCSTGCGDERGRPKLVHRLDKDTSGALLVARTARSAGHFAKAFSGRTAQKVYWAMVVGVPERRRGHDRRAAGQAAGHRRREDAHQTRSTGFRPRQAGG